MVYLTVTPPIVAAVQKYKSLGKPLGSLEKGKDPSLQDAKPGNPISYGQIVDLSRGLQGHGQTRDSEDDPYSLESLLRNSQVHTGNPDEEPEKRSDYERLMARLRREEESRAYDTMINPRTTGQGYTSIRDLTRATKPRETQSDSDEMTYGDVNRQMALIVNVIISILACSFAIWFVARYFSTPVRLALSMTGSALVAAAEVAIYAGYLRRLDIARTDERKKRESRVVMETWVIGKSDGKKSKSVDRPREEIDETKTSLRNRKGR